MTIIYSDSETKYNSHNKKIKTNEKMNTKEMLYQVIFSYFIVVFNIFYVDRGNG